MTISQVVRNSSTVPVPAVSRTNQLWPRASTRTAKLSQKPPKMPKTAATALWPTAMAHTVATHRPSAVAARMIASGAPNVVAGTWPSRVRASANDPAMKTGRPSIIGSPASSPDRGRLGLDQRYAFLRGGHALVRPRGERALSACINRGHSASSARMPEIHYRRWTLTSMYRSGRRPLFSV